MAFGRYPSAIVGKEPQARSRRRHRSGWVRHKIAFVAASRTVPDKKSEAWPAATQETRDKNATVR
jgi:hypothetical protein